MITRFVGGPLDGQDFPHYEGLPDEVEFLCPQPLRYFEVPLRDFPGRRITGFVAVPGSIVARYRLSEADGHFTYHVTEG